MFELKGNGQVSARGMCLGPAGDGRVVMLPCMEVDVGLQWAFSPFQIIAQTLTQRNPSRDNLLIINDGI